MGCGQGCLKAVLVAVNVIFFLAGAAVLGVGLWVKFDPNVLEVANVAAKAVDVQDSLDVKSIVNTLQTGAYVLIAFGAFTFVVGFCGCCGALKDSKCMIGLYITFVVAILAAEIAGGVYVYVNKDTLLGDLQNELKKVLHNDYGRNKSAGVDEVIDTVMQAFECCGFSDDPQADFANSYFYNKTKFPVPQACCKKDGEQYKDLVKCREDAKDKSVTKPNDYINKIGCIEAMQSPFIIVLGVAAGVAGFELLVAIFAICFCCGIEKD